MKANIILKFPINFTLLMKEIIWCSQPTHSYCYQVSSLNCSIKKYAAPCERTKPQISADFEIPCPATAHLYACCSKTAIEKMILSLWQPSSWSLNYISWGFYEMCIAKSPSYLLWSGYHMKNLQFWYIQNSSDKLSSTINNLWWAMQTYIPGISKITLLPVDFFFLAQELPVIERNSSWRIQNMWKMEFLGDILMKFVFENMHIIEKFTDKTLIWIHIAEND